MIAGIGTDLVEVERIAGIIARRGERFLQRVFTPGEIAYCSRHKLAAQHYAARFAAKEALLKALGIGLYAGVGLKEIEVVRRAGGRPELALHGGARDALRARGGITVHLTLTHTGSTAGAVVVVER